MKKYENLVKQTLIATSLWLSLPCDSSELSYSPQQLTELAEQWLQQQLAADKSQRQLDINALDSRIGNKTCLQVPEFRLSQPAGQRQNTVVIRCNDNPGWQLYLPVRIDEVRVGGQTQSIEVQPKNGAPAYQITTEPGVAPSDRDVAGQRTGTGGRSSWRILSF